MRFAIFPPRLSKVLRLPRKIEDRSYELPRLSRKIILAKLPIWCSKMPPYTGNQRPDLLTSLMDMSFVLRVPREMHLWRSSSNVPCLPSFLDMWQNPHVLLSFDQVHHFFSACHAEAHLNVQKCPVHPDFSTFDLEMCFAPQRRALFRHLNFQKWSEPVVFLTFWLGNVLRATTVCNCSSLIWPAGSAPAALVSIFVDRPEPQIIGKTLIFFLLFSDFLSCALLFSLTLPISAFHLSILSEVSLLNFLRLRTYIFNIFDAPFTTSKK